MFLLLFFLPDVDWLLPSSLWHSPFQSQSFCDSVDLMQVFLLWQGAWTRSSFEVPSNPWHSDSYLLPSILQHIFLLTSKTVREHCSKLILSNFSWTGKNIYFITLIWDFFHNNMKLIIVIWDINTSSVEISKSASFLWPCQIYQIRKKQNSNSLGNLKDVLIHFSTVLKYNNYFLSYQLLFPRLF